MNLNQITVPAIDVEKSIEFYENIGLNLIVKALPRYARFQCPEGNSTFSVHQVEALPIGDGVWVYFEVQNLDQHITNIIKKGIQVDEMPNDKSWLWRESRLRDPDNNQIILYFAGNNRVNPPWRL
jgi:predicted enzyme related to lactoylglutathione lyase